jgi:MYXO-CTERM domain-containing protein
MDGEEVLVEETDPLLPDTDGDGLSDGDEVYTYGTDPTDTDTDDGGVEDGVEVEAGTDPLNPDDDFPTTVEARTGGYMGGTCATAPAAGGGLWFAAAPWLAAILLVRRRR